MSMNYIPHQSMNLF